MGSIPLLTPSSYIQNVLILTFLMAVLGLGWNIMAGYAGYISLGHSAFIGVGAYTAGILAERWDVSPFLVAPLGGVAAALAALVLGLSTSRTRGPAFVIVSFAMLELLGLLARNFSSLTGGSQGFAMPLPQWDLTFYNWPFYYSLFALVLLSLLMTRAIRRSKFGLGLVAIRDDEDKAAGIGVVTPVYKSLAFMASAVLVGVAGAIYGYYISYLSISTMFDIVLSMQVVLAVLIGGPGNDLGAGARRIHHRSPVRGDQHDDGRAQRGRFPPHHVRRSSSPGDTGTAARHHPHRRSVVAAEERRPGQPHRCRARRNRPSATCQAAFGPPRMRPPTYSTPRTS